MSGGLVSPLKTHSTELRRPAGRESRSMLAYSSSSFFYWDRLQGAGGL